MWVVKLGGSLAGSAALDSWFSLCADHLPNSCIVPGGGIFANAVRASQARLGFDQDVGHELAVMAMEMYGHVLCRRDAKLRPAREIQDIRAIIDDHKVPVWFASSMLAASDDRALRDWHVTSDSLAVWLAGRLRAHGVLLVKSARLPKRDRLPLVTLQQSGIIDMGMGKVLRPGMVLRCVEAGQSKQAVQDLKAHHPVGVEVTHE